MTQDTKSNINDKAVNYDAKVKHKDEVLAEAIEDLTDSFFVREWSLSKAAESGDDIDVTAQLVDSDGSTSVSDTVRFRAVVVNEDDGLVASAAEFRITSVGTGTKVAPSSLDDPAAVIDTNSSGKAVFTVHDQGGASDQEVHVEIHPYTSNARVFPAAIELTFDNS